MNRVWRAWCAIAVAAAAVVGVGQALTPDAILARVEEQGFFGLGGGHASLYVVLSVTIERPGQPEARHAFRVWAKEYPDGTMKTLLLSTAPELVAGTMYLAHTPREGTGRVWLWLPALEVRKEIVADGDREGEFVAGSGITHDDIAAGFVYREGYAATLVGEEDVSGAPTWRLGLVPTAADEPWSRIHLWVHRESFTVLRAEFFDQGGRLSRVLTVPELIADAAGLRPARLIVDSPLEGSRATVEIEARSVEEIPDAYFEPENLGTLDL